MNDEPSSVRKQSSSSTPSSASNSLLTKDHAQKNVEASNKSQPPTPVMMGLGAAFVLHLGVLLSLPPVLRGRGAPYLPTMERHANAMFSLIRRHHIYRGGNFMDLGSGDGRLVFRAAREELFDKSVGVEINPVLFLWSWLRAQIFQRHLYGSTTEFRCASLWNVSLSSFQVVAVYGLSPIMTELGKKLEEELTPGSLVVSNVFPFPGWKVTQQSEERVFVYKVPQCFPSPARPDKPERTIPNC